MKNRIYPALLSAISIVLLMQIAPITFSDDMVYGYQLMTEQERAEHRTKMRNFNTEAEREAYRQQHHEMMQQRAKDQGVTLPDEPMPRGQGMGQGYRGGQGQGTATGKY